VSRRPYKIKDPDQLELLASPIRQEIVDAVAALGECSARELARELGVAPDALYYHLKKLVSAGLLASVGQRAATRRPEEVYRTAARDMLMVWDLDDPQVSAAILKAMGAVLRMAERDFRRGAELPTARSGTRDRNLGGGRVTAWLTRGELEQVNGLLGRVEQIFHGARRTRSRELVSLTWLIAPMAARERS
jgi:DNA-binding transcriptional ArsR family regulator